MNLKIKILKNRNFWSKFENNENNVQRNVMNAWDDTNDLQMSFLHILIFPAPNNTIILIPSHQR